MGTLGHDAGWIRDLPNRSQQRKEEGRHQFETRVPSHHTVRTHGKARQNRRGLTHEWGSRPTKARAESVACTRINSAWVDETGFHQHIPYPFVSNVHESYVWNEPRTVACIITWNRKHRFSIRRKRWYDDANEMCERV